MIFFMGAMTLTMLLLSLFSVLTKFNLWEKDSSTSFECGFSSGFSSRFSFSMHFYTVGLIFLFLDLELCFVMPFLSGDFSTVTLLLYCIFFVSILLGGLCLEWMNGELDWKF